MHKIFKCPNCGSYTLEETCNKCKVKTINPKPARFKQGDYSKYRRMYKEEMNNAVDI